MFALKLFELTREFCTVRVTGDYEPKLGHIKISTKILDTVWERIAQHWMIIKKNLQINLNITKLDIAQQ